MSNLKVELRDCRLSGSDHCTSAAASHQSCGASCFRHHRKKLFDAEIFLAARLAKLS